MKNDFVFSEWKSLFGDEGLSEFDKDYEAQRIRDENGRRYQPVETFEMEMDGSFSFLEFVNSRELNFNDYDLDNVKQSINWDLPIEKRMKEGSPYESEVRNCSNRKMNIEIPKESEIRRFLADIDISNRLDYNDFIAFYKPFHFNKKWGIYLYVDKIRDVARSKWEQIRRDHPNLSQDYIYDLVYHKTYFHEIYHHKIEMLATKLEFSFRAPIYGDKFYKFYCGTWGTDYCLEEAFANVDGARRCAELMKKKYGYKESFTIEIIREYLLRSADKGYRVAYEILNFGKQEIDRLESAFVEMLISYSYEELHGNRPVDIHAELYEMFTYKLDPKINFKNKVTFLRPS